MTINSPYSVKQGMLGAYSGGHEYESIDGSQFVGTDSKEYAYIFSNSSINGIVATVTYSNLKNSTYTDESGTIHRIAKIVRTFSNLDRLASASKDGKTWWGTQNGLMFYNDPSDGWWLLSSDRVTVHDDLYDEYGNPITINGNAYLSINSLDATYQNPEGTSYEISGTPSHVEYATAGSGTSALALSGSTITNHGGSLYSDKTNDPVGSHFVDIPEHTSINVKWDNHNNPNYYLGSGLLRINNNGYTYITGFKNPGDQLHELTEYVAPSTLIPVTPGPKGPEKPKLKTTSVHYHYDTNLI